MIEIGRAIVSREIFDACFACDLTQCKGACCIEGDSGAPLTEEEADMLAAGYQQFSEFLPEEHRQEIKKQGFSLTDRDGDLVTPLVANKQCAYSFYDGEILKCGIEKAWLAGRIPFRKPLSCQLFPVRISEYKHFDAVNYQQIEICRPGREYGLSRQIPLFRFLQDPFTRKYGKEWVEEMNTVAELLKNKAVKE
jgi:hypothetical protein